MLYMVVEHFKPNAASQIYDRARTVGRQLPKGLEYIDSWVDTDFTRCFQLMRAEDPAVFDEWIDAWSDLVDFDVIPVHTSRDAAELMRAVPSAIADG